MRSLLPVTVPERRLFLPGVGCVIREAFLQGGGMCLRLVGAVLLRRHTSWESFSCFSCFGALCLLPLHIVSPVCGYCRSMEWLPICYMTDYPSSSFSPALSADDALSLSPSSVSASQMLDHAWEFVEHTSKSVFLTGKAGTGKTTFLRRVVSESTKRLVVVAPTGVAAVNAGGVTIHSFFQLPFSPFVPGARMKSKFEIRKEKLRIIRTLDLLIIDEISMVRSDLLDAVDFMLRTLRNDQRPFGGVQLLLIGDLQQLTPVVKHDEEALLREHYATPYFFDSTALRKVDYVTIELTHVYRQSDEHFVALLNRVRQGMVGPADLQALNARWVPDFVPPQGEDFIRLTTHNASADRYNRQALEALSGKACAYVAAMQGTFPEYAYPTDVELTLKVGAQVMFVKNDGAPHYRFYNGRIGHVTALREEGVKVRCPGDDADIEVAFEVWENTKYTLNEQTREIESEVQGRFVQLPLRLAWAITIHKSQGLTFDHAVIEANRSFAPGQVYVALSRCRTLEGMVLAAPLPAHAIINDHRVDHYIAQQEEKAQQSISQLPASKDAYVRTLLVECFTFTALMQGMERLYKLVLEHLRSRYPQLAYESEQAFKQGNERIQQVSWRWSQRLLATDAATLADAAFLQRVDDARIYFLEQLQTLFVPLLDKMQKTDIRNKETKKRMDDTLADCRVSCLAKVYLLEDLAGAPFATERYLRAKQLALLDAMDGGRRRKKRAAAR